MTVTSALVGALLAAAPAVALANGNVCISSYRIDHTERPDDSQILFYMNDKSVYQAKVQGGCVGLSNDSLGFTYEPDPGTEEICGNLFTITLNTTHTVCMMGAFKQIKAARR